ncbi:MAG: hypothetical protein U9Q63_01225, partial [Patescibacteria group bacterium]|nr:hypothetical protein [Patescibacteria group bacterium]
LQTESNLLTKALSSDLDQVGMGVIDKTIDQTLKKDQARFDNLTLVVEEVLGQTEDGVGEEKRQGEQVWRDEIFEWMEASRALGLVSSTIPALETVIDVQRLWEFNQRFDLINLSLQGIDRYETLEQQQLAQQERIRLGRLVEEKKDREQAKATYELALQLNNIVENIIAELAIYDSPFYKAFMEDNSDEQLLLINQAFKNSKITEDFLSPHNTTKKELAQSILIDLQRELGDDKTIYQARALEIKEFLRLADSQQEIIHEVEPGQELDLSDQDPISPINPIFISLREAILNRAEQQELAEVRLKQVKDQLPETRKLFDKLSAFTPIKSESALAVISPINPVFEQLRLVISLARFVEGQQEKSEVVKERKDLLLADSQYTQISKTTYKDEAPPNKPIIVKYDNSLPIGISKTTENLYGAPRIIVNIEGIGSVALLNIHERGLIGQVFVAKILHENEVFLFDQHQIKPSKLREQLKKISTDIFTGEPEKAKTEIGKKPNWLGTEKADDFYNDLIAIKIIKDDPYAGHDFEYEIDLLNKIEDEETFYAKQNIIIRQYFTGPEIGNAPPLSLKQFRSFFSTILDKIIIIERLAPHSLTADMLKAGMMESSSIKYKIHPSQTENLQSAFMDLDPTEELGKNTNTLWEDQPVLADTISQALGLFYFKAFKNQQGTTMKLGTTIQHIIEDHNNKWTNLPYDIQLLLIGLYDRSFAHTVKQIFNNTQITQITNAELIQQLKNLRKFVNIQSDKISQLNLQNSQPQEITKWLNNQTSDQASNITTKTPEEIRQNLFSLSRKEMQNLLPKFQKRLILVDLILQQSPNQKVKKALLKESVILNYTIGWIQLMSRTQQTDNLTSISHFKTALERSKTLENKEISTEMAKTLLSFANFHYYFQTIHQQKHAQILRNLNKLLNTPQEYYNKIKEISRTYQKTILPFEPEDSTIKKLNQEFAVDDVLTELSKTTQNLIEQYNESLKQDNHPLSTIKSFYLKQQLQQILENEAVLNTNLTQIIETITKIIEDHEKALQEIKNQEELLTSQNQKRNSYSDVKHEITMKIDEYTSKATLSGSSKKLKSKYIEHIRTLFDEPIPTEDYQEIKTDLQTLINRLGKTQEALEKIRTQNIENKPELDPESFKAKEKKQPEQPEQPEQPSPLSEHQNLITLALALPSTGIINPITSFVDTYLSLDEQVRAWQKLDSTLAQKISSLPQRLKVVPINTRSDFIKSIKDKVKNLGEKWKEIQDGIPMVETPITAFKSALLATQTANITSINSVFKIITRTIHDIKQLTLTELEELDRQDVQGLLENNGLTQELRDKAGIDKKEFEKYVKSMKEIVNAMKRVKIRDKEDVGITLPVKRNLSIDINSPDSEGEWIRDKMVRDLDYYRELLKNSETEYGDRVSLKKEIVRDVEENAQDWSGRVEAKFIGDRYSS